MADTLLVLMLAALAVAAFLWNREWVFFAGDVFFVDGDCYARMTRVRLLEGAPFAPLRVHGFENFPDGTVPHTTFPLDGLILLLRWILAPLGATALPIAGAFVSPILGLFTLLFLAWWASRLALPFRWPALIVFAVSPMAAQAFLLGRPDHQSLVVLLVAVALGAEAAMWLGRKAVGWRYAAAAAWALALWTSLFEPLIVLGVVLALRGVRRLVFGESGARPAFGPVGVFAGILLVAFFWDGWRAGGFDPHFRDWAATIGELRGAPPLVLLAWCGWLLPVVIVLLGWNTFRNRFPSALLWLGLLVVVTGLTLWHARWGYLLVLVFAMSLPDALVVIRPAVVAFVVFVVSLFPIASEWDAMLFPEDTVFRARAENLADAVAVRDAAQILRWRPAGAVLAPWWLSPSIVWWSGFPTVGGTSHQSLPGIVDSARFYLSENDADAVDILLRRRARYVFGYDPGRLVENSVQILRVNAPGQPMAARLFSREVPAELALLYGNRLVRVFELRSAYLEHEQELTVSPLWSSNVEGRSAGETNRRGED
ncbi:MAG: hypothetical protein SFU53_02035 [Terrimicrobiaceae bacterium]|nr:hypothetical protein [Terrimicrobiaceae bacterium]